MQLTISFYTTSSFLQGTQKNILPASNSCRFSFPYVAGSGERKGQPKEAKRMATAGTGASSSERQPGLNPAQAALAEQ